MNCESNGCPRECDKEVEILSNGSFLKVKYCNYHYIRDSQCSCYNCNCGIAHCNYYKRRFDEKTFYLCVECSHKYAICECCQCVFEKTDNWGACYECRYIKYIKDYFYKPEPIFQGKNTSMTVPYIGVEFEIGGGIKSKLEEFLKEYHKNDFVYCKYDSSIPNYGCEIVSHPATFTAHKKIMPWKDIFLRLKELNIQNFNNCGIHFHVNRTFFTENNIKVADYMVNNFNSIMEIIGDRRYNRYCSRRNKMMYQWGSSEFTAHHDAINLGNSKTIEFRFCRSTNDYDFFINKVKFIHHFCKFIKKVTFKQLVENTEEYKNIFKEYINENVEELFK